MLSRFFRLQENGTTVGRELQAGLTTFAAMAYVLAVNPTILANAGMDRAALVTITALSAATATVLMALLTNYPIALAPGMGINAFFTFSICLGAGVPWSQALGMVFVNGCIFLLLSVTGVREKIVDSIPYPLKIAITCGIGIFIAFIGLKNGGVVVASPATFVTHGDFASGPVALCLGGILLTAVLVARRVPGAIVLGIAMIVSAAGTAIVKSSILISTADCSMKTPTSTSAGAVATAGTARINGVRNNAATINAAVVSVVSPVRPPASTPDADSM